MSEAALAEYGLPAAGDVAAWDRLLRPCTGRLQRVEPPRRLGGVAPRRPRSPLTAVTVWVHCGVHTQAAPRSAGAAWSCTPPTPGDLPPVGAAAADSRWGFFPLCRDRPGAPPAACVRVFCAAAAEGVHGHDGRWGVAVAAPAAADPPLRLLARSRADAESWAAQLRARAAPLAAVRARRGGGPGRGPGGGAADGGDAAAGGPDDAAVAAALRDGARRVLAADVVTGVAGVVTALVEPNAYNLAVAAGPVAGVALGALGFAARVLVAARCVFEAAAGVAADLDDLHGKLVEHVLPSLQDLPAEGRIGVGDLLNKLGLLVADTEALAGELHHLVRSRRRRVGLAIRSAHRREGVGADLQARLRMTGHSADELVQLIQLALQRRSVAVAEQTRHAVAAASPQASAMRAVRNGLPPLPPNIFNDWADAELPAARLYTAVIQSDSTTCAAVGAHGQGGVGKTLSCLLVAHRVAEGADGRRRFPNGAHWVQLSQDTSAADVKQRVCDLATSLSGEHVVANDLDVAVGYLRTALHAKSCLLVVDDVWDDRWAATFMGALPTVSTGSCLLLSTRRVDIAARTGVSTSVQVDTHGRASAAGVLLVHAEAGGKTWADKTDELVQGTVSVCGGLALALAVMGSLVRERGWAPAVALVRRQRDALPSKSLPVDARYQLSLRACLLASYRALGVGVDAAEQPLWHARFQALCIVRPKEQLPQDALAALWGEDDPDVVWQIGRTLHDRSLVTLCGDPAVGTLSLSLHDLVIDFLSYPGLMSQAQREEVHAKMVSAYCERHEIGNDSTSTRAFGGPSCVTVRKLWELRPDGYVEHALPRLLCAGGVRGRLELRALLFHWRFVAWRVKVGDGSCGVYRLDARMDKAAHVDLLDKVATVVEGALVHPEVALSERLQQAAWEVMERFASWPRVADGETDAHLLPLLLATARSYLNEPVVELYGATRLRLPQERRVFGCDSGVRSVCSNVNSNGVLLIAGLESGSLKCWEERSGKCVAVLEGHTGAVTCTAALGGGGIDGGGLVLSGSIDRTVRVWDVSSGQCVRVLKGHTGDIESLAVLDGGGSDGGGRVVSESADHTLRVWEVGSGKCVAVLQGCTGWTRCLAVLDGGRNNSGGRVVSASDDYCIRVWEVDSAKCVAVLEGHTGVVRCLTVLEGGGGCGGARVVSGSYDLSVRVWDVDSGQCVAVLNGHTNWVACLAELDGCASGGGGRVVSGSADCTVRVWDVASGMCAAVLKGHTSTVRDVRVLDGGKSGGARQIVSGSDDHSLRMWDVASGLCVAVLNGHTAWVRCLTVLDGGGRDGGGLVVSGSDDNTVRVWEADRDEHMTVLESCSGWLRCLAALNGDGIRDGGRVVSGSSDHSVRVWDVDSGMCVAVLNGHTSSVRCLVVLNGGGSNGGARVVTGSNDRSVRVWDVDTGTCVAVLNGHTKWVRCLAVLDGGGSSGGGRVVSGSHDRTVRVWDVSSGKCVSVWTGHTREVECIAVLRGGESGGGGRVVSGSHDRSVRVWDVSSGKCVAVLNGHTDWVRCLAVLDGGGGGGGRRVVSGSDDQTVRVWDVDGGTCVAVVQCATSQPKCFAVLGGGGRGGGGRAVSGSADAAGSAWWSADVPSAAVVGGPRAAALSRSVRPGTSTCVAADGGAPAWAGTVFLLDQRGRCAVVHFRHDAGCWSSHLRYLPAPPGAAAMCCVSPSVVAWGTKDGHVYFGRRGVAQGPP